MAELLTRTTPTDLEVRSDGRTVVGIAVPFDAPAEIGPVSEVFRRGAFARTIAERGSRVKFLALHDQGRLPLGRATLLREDASGLYAEFRVSATAAGDEALELIRDGALDSLSIGFRPIRDAWNATRSIVERLEVALAEVSAVAFPAYDGAAITAVRSDTLTDARARLDALTTPSAPESTFCADDHRRRLTLLELTP